MVEAPIAWLWEVIESGGTLPATPTAVHFTGTLTVNDPAGSTAAWVEPKYMVVVWPASPGVV